MKRTVILLLVIVVLSGLLTGCEQAVAKQQEESADQPLPDGYTEVYGKVKSANGNELTLALGTLPSSNTPSSSGGRAVATSDDSGGLPAGEAPPLTPAGDSQESVEDAPESPAGRSGQRGSGNGQQTGGPPAGQDMSRPDAGGGDTAGGTMGAAGGMSAAGGTTLEYTGEEVTCQIPVTARVTTGQGDSARTVSFTQIGYKNIVKLTLNEEGQIVSVVILQ